MSKVHAMVDIETLDTQPTAVIASIAIVKFTLEHEVTESRCWNVALQPQIDAGRTISASTLQFWFNQDKPVQESTFLAATMSPVGVIHELDELLGEDTLLWGNGATFDNVLIKNFAQSFWPWGLRHKYYNDRCFRTIAALFDPKKKLRPHNYAKHDALADAENQAQWFLNIAREHTLKDYL